MNDAWYFWQFEFGNLYRLFGGGVETIILEIQHNRE